MRLLPDNLREAAARRPDGCAIKSGEDILTYGQLQSRATSFASWLRSIGVGKGDRVALLSEASSDYVTAYYGVLMAGAAAVALNAAARADDLIGWIEHADVRLLYVDPSHPAAAELRRRLRTGIMVVSSGSSRELSQYLLGEICAAAGDGSDLPSCEPEDLAAIIYTSGTTGRPKGVMLDHGNLASNTQAIVSYLDLCASDRIVCVLPFYYSFGNSVLHTHVAVGAEVVIEPNLVYPHRVVEAMVREKATGFAGGPSTFALLTARVKLDTYDLSALRYLAQAGGPMAPALAQKVRAMLPRARLFIMYGLTEASARVSYVPPDMLESKRGSIGTPIPGVEMEIRQENGERAPSGASGELWVRGRNVMTGYWKDAEATRATLVNGWLRTGDSARVDEDGYYYIEGRRSDIIKVGAHRVYPRDIEAAIEEIDGVIEAGVTGIDDEILGQVIKAFVVRAANATLAESDVKAHCRERLATYKIPKAVEFVTALPKTASGKLRRHLLSDQLPGLRQL